MEIAERKYGTTAGGEEIYLYTMGSSCGPRVQLCNIGAAVVSAQVPGRNGEMADVVLGYENLFQYIGDGPCMGKVPGRVAGRIAGGRFELDGSIYYLPANNGPNHLHGGPGGFANRVWHSFIERDRVVFTLESPDGDAGYPGKLNVRAEYRWNTEPGRKNETAGRYRLEITLRAKTDAPTVVNLTNHTYFNLNGRCSGTVLDQLLELHASRYLPTDSFLIPTGELLPVEGTPMDFTRRQSLGGRIREHFPELLYGRGYDACWAVDGWVPGYIQKVAALYSERSGRMLQVYSDQPGIIVYTGNWLSDSPAEQCGGSYKDYEGIALECQKFPDAPNRPGFPGIALYPGDEYLNRIIFEFGTW